MRGDLFGTKRKYVATTRKPRDPGHLTNAPRCWHLYVSTVAPDLWGDVSEVGPRHQTLKEAGTWTSNRSNLCTSIHIEGQRTFKQA